MANELKSLTLNGKKYTSFVDLAARANGGSGGSSGSGGTGSGGSGGGNAVPEVTSIMPTEDEFTVGKFVHYDTGNIIDTTNHRCTEDYIPIPVGARLMTHYSTNSTKQGYPYVVYYDENKTFISSEDGSGLTQEDYDGKLCAFYNVPENTRFIRLSVIEAYFAQGYFQYLYLYTITEAQENGGVDNPSIEENPSAVGIPSDVVRATYQNFTEEQKAQARENIGAAPMSLFNIIEGVDATEATSIMPSEDAFTVGKMIHYDTGNIIDSTNYRSAEEYIPFPVGVRLMTHYSANSTKQGYPLVLYYDANKTFISSEFGSGLTQEDYDGKLCAFYNVPENTRFIRLSVSEAYFAQGYFQYLYLYVVANVKVNGGVEIPELIVQLDAIPNSDLLVRGALPLLGKTIVNFGDSIFGNAQPPTDISTFLAEKTGATVYNCGFGGCRMSPHPTAEYHAFSMYKLADAISTGDFTEQENAVNSTTVTLNNAIKSNFATLKTIDFSKVDIVTIAYGANDYNGALLDNEENPLDVTTFGGALRYSIETLLTAYPHLRIFVLSTTWKFWIDENNEYVDDSNTHTNGLNKLRSDYDAQLKAVAGEYNLPFVDNYNIGIGKFNRSYYFNANDGSHHKETGRNAIASHLAKKLW